MAGGSKSESEPVDKTPEAFKRLQQPFADVIAQMLGFEPSAGGGGFGAGGVAGGGQQQQDLRFIPTSRGDTRLVTPEASQINAQGQFIGSGGEFAATGQAGVAGAGGSGGQIGFPGGPNFQPAGDGQDILRGIPTPDTPLQAGITSGEEAGLSQLQQAALGTQANAGLASGVLGSTAAGGFLPGAEGGGNPFLQSAIEAAQRPTLQGLEETLSRTLPGRFTEAGQFTQPEGSSAFDRAAAIATRGVAQELGDIASNLSFAGFESERGRQQEAAQALPQVSAQEVNTLTQNLQAQALPRLIEQAGIEEGTRRFNQQMQNLLQTLALSQGITAPVIANQSSSRTKPNVFAAAGDAARVAGGGFG